MNDDDLKQFLVRHTLPAASDEVRGRALHRALVALRIAPEKRKETAFAWILGTSAAAALLLLVAVLWRGNDDNGALLAEMEQFFGGNLAGVVIGDEVEVLMNDNALPRPADQRVAVDIVSGSSRVRVLTYSGNRVCLPLGGQSICLTPLIDGDGRVFVVPEDGALPAQSHITARRIQG